MPRERDRPCGLRRFIIEGVEICSLKDEMGGGGLSLFEMRESAIVKDRYPPLLVFEYPVCLVSWHVDEI